MIYTYIQSFECIVVVTQTERCVRACVRERRAGGGTSPLWLKVNSPTLIPPSLPHERLGLSVGQPGPIWGPLIGSRALWARAQRNQERLLYSAPLYTKLIVIPSSTSKMGLLGAIGFSLALVSLTQVSVIYIYIHIYTFYIYIFFLLTHVNFTVLKIGRI